MTHHMIRLASLKTLLAAAQLLIDGHWGRQTAHDGTALSQSGWTGSVQSTQRSVKFRAAGVESRSGNAPTSETRPSAGSRRWARMMQTE